MVQFKALRGGDPYANRGGERCFRLGGEDNFVKTEYFVCDASLESTCIKILIPNYIKQNCEIITALGSVDVQAMVSHVNIVCVSRRTGMSIRVFDNPFGYEDSYDSSDELGQGYFYGNSFVSDVSGGGVLNQQQFFVEVGCWLYTSENNNICGPYKEYSTAYPNYIEFCSGLNDVNSEEILNTLSTIFSDGGLV